MEIFLILFFLLCLGFKWVWRDVARGYHAFEVELERLRKEGDQ